MNFEYSHGLEQTVAHGPTCGWCCVWPAFSLYIFNCQQMARDFLEFWLVLKYCRAGSICPVSLWEWAAGTTHPSPPWDAQLIVGLIHPAGSVALLAAVGVYILSPDLPGELCALRNGWGGEARKGSRGQLVWASVRQKCLCPVRRGGGLQRL